MIRTRRSFRLLALAGFALGVVFATALPARSQTDRDDADRLVQALAIQPGHVVGEIGAGRGALTVAVARAVGPDGRVYSNELDAARRDDIARAVADAKLMNVTLIEGRPDGTNMPAACCRALFMRDVFHHVEDKPAMARSLLATLEPGGRLGVLDFPVRGSHGMPSDEVRGHLERAGFADVKVEASGARWYLVTATRPRT
jgi:ubiquinone/menaquinone biosynthesis C-methylase UbiE